MTLCAAYKKPAPGASKPIADRSRHGQSAIACQNQLSEIVGCEPARRHCSGICGRLRKRPRQKISRNPCGFAESRVNWVNRRCRDATNTPYSVQLGPDCNFRGTDCL